MPLAARILVLALALMAATCGQKGPLTPPAQSHATGVPQVSDVPAMVTKTAAGKVGAERDA